MDIDLTISSNNLILPAEARPYVLYQRTELLPKRSLSLWEKVLCRIGLDDGYKNFVERYAVEASEAIDDAYAAVMKEKAESLLRHVPNNVDAVMDIGCGIAALDVFLYRELNGPKLFLVDKTKVEDKIWYMFESSGAFYNSLELARSVLVANGVSSDDVVLVEAPDDNRISIANDAVDLVVSTISWGFHYPVSTYLESVAELLSDRGVLLIDVRDGTGGDKELEKRFRVEALYEYEKYKTYKCTKD